jgi:HEAT repeat protein
MARNAAMVLGNLRDDAHLWLLEQGLTDIGWEVRQASAWALGCFALNNKKLENHTDPDPRVTQTVIQALRGDFLVVGS